MFDALTSLRPYKHAWSNEEAFNLLSTLAGTKLDGDCIQALIEHIEEIKIIQAQFNEDEQLPRDSVYDDTLNN